MKRITLLLCLTFAVSALAWTNDELGLLADGGSPAAAVAAVPYGGALTAPSPVLADPGTFAKIVFTSVKDGNWWAAAAAILVLVVSLLRTYGMKLHEWLPDNKVWDVPLKFIFDTKPGGWLLNVATAVAGGVGGALVSGSPVNWALVKPILMVAVTGAALWEMGKDLFEWIKLKTAKAADPAPVPPPPAVPPVK